jgi:hypothetical protein
MDDGSVLGIGAGGGVATLIVYILFRYCYKKELHTKCKSHCCETSVDVDDNSSPVKSTNT